MTSCGVRTASHTLAVDSDDEVATADVGPCRGAALADALDVHATRPLGPGFEISSFDNSRTDTPISDPAPNARNTSDRRSRSKVCADTKETSAIAPHTHDDGSDGRSPLSKCHDFLPKL